MSLDFGFEGIRSTAFGVGRETEESEAFFLLPVDDEVQTDLALRMRRP
jgi:hypothetical protein